jgi:hypothetical protein
MIVEKIAQQLTEAERRATDIWLDSVSLRHCFGNP